MTHPEALLADYVDGSLTGDAAEDVARHLTTCATCREEVQAAAAARGALAVLPRPRTPDLSSAVAKEIEAGRLESIDRRWSRVAGWAAAAAVVVLVVAALPRIGSQDDLRTAATGAAAEDAGGAEGAPTVPSADRALEVELEQVDYTQDTLRALAEQLAGVELGPDEGFAAAPDAVIGAGNAAEKASRCAAASAPGRPVRLISATFEGTPAYLAIYLEGPAEGQAADTVKIWVVSIKRCTPLALATARL